LYGIISIVQSEVIKGEKTMSDSTELSTKVESSNSNVTGIICDQIENRGIKIAITAAVIAIAGMFTAMGAEVGLENLIYNGIDDQLIETAPLSIASSLGKSAFLGGAVTLFYQCGKGDAASEIKDAVNEGSVEQSSDIEATPAIQA